MLSSPVDKRHFTQIIPRPEMSGVLLGGDKVLSPPSKRIPLAFALILCAGSAHRRKTIIYNIYNSSSAFRLYVPQLPEYPVIYHRICLIQCQNLAACAATDFDAQKQIPCGVFVFCAVHARAKMDLILFAARTLRGFFSLLWSLSTV